MVLRSDGVSVCTVSCIYVLVFFFKQKTAYEMRISDWSSDVCSSDLGKSTLSYVLAGRDGYEVTGGSVTFDGQDLLALEPHQRAAAGIFQIGRASCRERVCQYV